MIDKTNEELRNVDTPEQPEISISNEDERNYKKFMIIAIIMGIILIALVVVATIFLVRPENSAMTEQIRDVFIIFMAFASLILGIALIILIIQLATLINLLQNEIKPILDSTTEAVNTLKGTTQFISNNLTEPVIKLNQYLAMFKRLIKPKKQ